MTAGDIYFGALNINDGSSYRVLRETPIRLAGPDLLRLSLAVRPGSVTAQRRQTERTVAIAGSVHGATASALDNARDALIKALSNGVQNLKLGFQDERYYRAELVGEVEQARLGGPLAWFYTANFLLADPYAYAASASTEDDDTELDDDGDDNYSKTITVTPGGTAPARPVITIEVPNGSSFGITQIAVQNQTPAEQPKVTVPGTFAADDILIIDIEAETVELNGDPIDFEGSLELLLDPRVGTTNAIVVSAIASSQPTLNCDIDWTARYA